MSERVSCVFLTMPTSGTGSLWRIITAIAGNDYKCIKITEELEAAGQGADIPNWRPEPRGHLYMYNTPHFVNENLADPGLKLITNFRDPRDLACNQYHWALQHPVSNHSEEYIENFRRSVEANGIDAFVAKQDNTILFKSLQALTSRLHQRDENVVKLSYSQLCLDFDNLLQRLIAFLGASNDTVPWELLERERTVNLEKNPNWIGQVWTGTDIMPGRYRKELRQDTIALIDRRYKDSLKFLRSLELPQLRPLLATEAERPEMERVLVGKSDELFLQKDANNTVGQITGQTRLSTADMVRIGMAHRNRQLFGGTLSNFQYGHAVIPSKEVSYQDMLPEGTVFEQYGYRPVKQYLESDVTCIWRPFYEEALLKPKNGTRFFPQTDSHWTHAGAFRYFESFIAQMSPAVASRFREVQVRHFPGRQQGDLGLKLEMKDEAIEIIAPAQTRAKVVFENGITNEGCVRWYRNPAVPSGNIAFVMHDSFTLWLLAIVPELFSEVVLFHGTVFDYDFVCDLAPNFVFCLQAERFFVRAPETGGDMIEFVARQEQDKNAQRHLIDFLNSDIRFSQKLPPAGT